MNTIKPIETHYKGYRFRSRLEARWAVFFDALGIEWEYEKEGFELDKVWYLPDFYLSHQETYLEIKPLLYHHKYEQIYLAGKMEVSGWRHELTKWFRGDCAVVGGYRCVGPNHIKSHDRWGREDEVVENCLAEIKDADILFAHIETGDCHATLSEVGIAKILHKTIWINFTSEKLNNEMWFAGALADKVTVNDNVFEAFQSHLPTLTEEEEKCRLLSMNGKRVFLCQGDPYEAKVQVFDDGKMVLKGMNIDFDGEYVLEMRPGWSYTKTSQHVKQAKQKARSARFEHGESG